MYDVSFISFVWDVAITSRWMRVTVGRYAYRWAGGGYSRWFSLVAVVMMLVIVVVVMMVVVSRRWMRVTMRWYTDRWTGSSHFGRTFHDRDHRYRFCIMSRSDMGLTSELITSRRIVRNSGSLMLSCISFMKPGRSSIFR